ncbi:hypothetical protein CRE_31280 [Caenorhabditis remanei]|uniref:Uncharacterized protein n=1 Tax=Caenorhabditis remanei TaxID=31234 RepID=E3MLM2_CAERE|nr:hypothetical protein CRE_31280 [Caenorhabditis remanei]
MEKPQKPPIWWKQQSVFMPQTFDPTLTIGAIAVDEFSSFTVVRASKQYSDVWEDSITPSHQVANSRPNWKYSVWGCRLRLQSTNKQLSTQNPERIKNALDENFGKWKMNEIEYKRYWMRQHHLSKIREAGRYDPELNE